MDSNDLPDPQFFLVAGAPGSGKSALLPVSKLVADGFNADDAAAVLNGGSYLSIPSSIRTIVNRNLEEFVSTHIRDRIGLAVETTLRSTIALDQAKQAREVGFYTSMSYIATADEAINLRRVAVRSEGGGHAASKGTLLDIRAKSFANLWIAIDSVGASLDSLSVYDNSVDGRYMTRAFSLRFSLIHNSLSIERNVVPPYLETYFEAANRRVH